MIPKREIREIQLFGSDSATLNGTSADERFFHNASGEVRMRASDFSWHNITDGFGTVHAYSGGGTLAFDAVGDMWSRPGLSRRDRSLMIISVLAAQEVSSDFDSQFSALSKRYRYRILARPSPSPLARERSWHIPSLLDLAAMAAEWLDMLAWVNRRPSVSIVLPLDQSKIPFSQETIVISAEASDPDGTVEKVEFFANNAKIGEDADASDGWSLSWWAHSQGGYQFTVRATDDSGAYRLSRPVAVTVGGGM